MNELTENLSHAMRGAALMFYILLSAKTFPERNENNFKKILFWSMVFLCILVLKDMMFLVRDVWDNRYFCSISMLADLLYVPLMALFFFEAVSPGWIRPKRVIAMFFPVAAALVLYAIHPDENIVRIVMIYIVLFGIAVIAVILMAISRRNNRIKDYFSDIRFATRINVREMQCVDIPESPGSTFYGDVSATGSVEISGPVRSILMTVNAVTTGDGQFHIPLSSSATSGSGNLLTFKQPVTIRQTDPYEEMMARFKEQESSPGDFSMKIRVAATPEVEALIEIDKATGNVLSGRGEGVIDLEIQPKKDIFNITGDYTISSGNYRFVALGLASRDFSIQEGSSVRFNGDIMESTLEIDAVYRTKASLSTLIADTTSVSNRRTVECGISITDQIRNPRLGFSINIPDLDPMVQSRVESALSTEDKVQKQFLSLIISNSFLPDEQSGIVNNSTLLYSNVTDIMANQLNNIFQKLDIPLDLGLSYQPNDKGNDIFDVAVSTQLFNNRVIVNGNIGNRQYSSGSGESDVVGDLDIEIKLTRNGALRLNLFSHSADEYTNYLDNSQRNGVGIAYQKEFDRLDTFFRNMFTGKKKREEAQRREMEMMRGRERKVIRITGNEDGRRRENKHVSKDGR